MIRGSRFNPEKNRFTWRSDWEAEDDKENLPDEVRIGKICQVAMNSINEDLVFTIETVHDFVDRMLATLDFKCEVIANQISYLYEVTSSAGCSQRNE